MILLIDNYDSFTFNLYQYMGTINPDITVVRNDAMTIDEVIEMAPDRIVISPGPGYPVDAGICIPLVQRLAAEGIAIPTLGICLGHQAICEAFGATIGHAKELMHGKQSTCTVDTNSVMFKNMQPTCEVARYHSLAALPETLPETLRATAHTEDGEIMAVEHTSMPIYGLQFHPESIMTPEGMTMLKNFLE